MQPVIGVYPLLSC